MDNTALVLIVITNLTLVIILGALAFLIYKLLKQNTSNSRQEPSSNSNNFHPGIQERMNDLKSIKRASLFCPNHSDEPGEVSCAICDQIFCKKCIKPFKNLHFCKEHLPLLMKNDWEEVLTVKTSTEDPEEGVRLYEAKKKLYLNLSIPTYIETHYKINVDHDYIETYLVVFSLFENLDFVREELADFQ
jgi:hypothetical protein